MGYPFPPPPPPPPPPPDDGKSTDDDGDGVVVEPGEPHGALFLVLRYLRLADLLSFYRVCRLLRDAVAIDDRLLWRHIVVEPPLSTKLTDEALLSITSRAGGLLRTLALLDCRKVTDAGLRRVVQDNPFITKLYLPGCTYLTAEGVVSIVKGLTDDMGKLKHLRINGILNVTKEHLDILHSLIHQDHPQQDLRRAYYGVRQVISPDGDDSRPIDIDICPKCNNARLVFDCTRESCRSMEGRWAECRGCFFCIARCEECGGCIDFEEFGEETACSHLLCLGCWLQLPKCNMCNRPYCRRHTNNLADCFSSAGFICEECRDLELSSTLE